MKKLSVLLLCVVLMSALLLTSCTIPGSTGESNDGSTGGTSNPISDNTSGATTPPKEKASLKIEAWGIETDQNSVIIKEAVALYNERYKDTAEISVEFTEQEQFKTKIATLMASNEAPDLFNTWAAGFLKPFVEANKVYSISDDTERTHGKTVLSVEYSAALPLMVRSCFPNTQTVVCFSTTRNL